MVRKKCHVNIYLVLLNYEIGLQSFNFNEIIFGKLINNGTKQSQIYNLISIQILK